MQNRTDGPTYQVAVWSIENFSCWNSEIHGKVIISPESLTSPTFIVKLFPKGPSGRAQRLVVRLTCSSASIGEVSFIGSDGSLLCKQEVYSIGGKKDIELQSGLKFEEVITQIKENEALHGDRLIVRYQTIGRDVTEHMNTTIDALEVSLKIYPEIFNSIESTRDAISLLKFPLRETELESIRLDASKDQIADSKIALTLNPVFYEKKVLVFTRLSILSNDDVVRTEENEHLFRDNSKWIFSNTLTRADVAKEGFSLTLTLYFKVSNYKHSYELYQYRPFKMDIVKLNRIKPPETITSEEQSPKSLPTVTSHKPSESSLTVLSSELMCLYQDQDFSDFQLKCGDVSVPVHKNILSARSPVFKTMLSTDMRESVSGCMDIEDMDPSTLGLFLAYLYTGAVEDLQGESALKLYYTADKYQVPSLKRECVSVLCSSVSISNVCDILSLADKHQDDQLIAVAHNFFLKNYNEVVRSAEWKTLMKSEPMLALETLSNFAVKNHVSAKFVET